MQTNLSPMARAIAFLIEIASQDDDEAGPGEILADHPEPAHRTNGEARRLGHGNPARPVGQVGGMK